MSFSRQMLSDVLAYFEANSIATWVFGGWGEELQRLARPREHRDIDLLYPCDSFAMVDALVRRDGVQEIRAKRLAHKRAVVLDGVVVEMFLLRRDDRGPHTLFWGRVRHDWPADVLGTVGGQRVASVAALRSYRAAHRRLRAEGHDDRPAVQSHLSRELGEPIPRCPLHVRALALVVADGGFGWVCPACQWRCPLGEYAERAWPRFDSRQLPGILAGRLTRRGFTWVRSIRVTGSEAEPVAVVGVAQISPELVAALRDAAAPLPVEVYEQRWTPRRAGDASGTPGPDAAAPQAATVRLELAERSACPGGELRFAVVNDGTTSILMGVDYGLECRLDSDWWAIDPGCAFAAVGLVLEPGQRRELTARIPPCARPGVHRLRKRVRVARETAPPFWGPGIDDLQGELTAEFDVVEVPDADFTTGM